MFIRFIAIFALALSLSTSAHAEHELVRNLKLQYPNAKASSGITVQLLHIEGIAPDPKLAELERELTEAGFTIERIDLNRASFKAAALEFTHDLNLENVGVRASPTTALTSTTPVTPSKRLASRVRRLTRWLFGMKHGLTLWGHIYKKNPEGKTTLKYPSRAKSYTVDALGTMGFGTALLSAGILGQGGDLLSGDFILPILIYSTWVYTLTRYNRELNSFRSQGNYLLFNALSIIPDVFFNSVMLALLSIGFHEGLAPGELLQESLTRGILSTYAIAPIEDIRARLTRKAEHAKNQGDLKNYHRLEARSSRLMRLYYWVLFPVMNSLHLLAQSSGSVLSIDLIQNAPQLQTLPFVIAGSVGLGYKVWTSRAQIWKAVKNGAVACRALLRGPQSLDF